MAYEYKRETHLRDSVCVLCHKVTESDSNGVMKQVGMVENEVCCRVGSVYEKEFYDALQAGIKAQYKLVINTELYSGQKIVRFEGQYYSVYRKYQEGDNVELYLRKDTGTWD